MTYTTPVRVLLLSFLVFLCVPFSLLHADDTASSTSDVVATSTTPVDASSTPSAPTPPPQETIQLTVRAGDTVATSSLVTMVLTATSTNITPSGTTTPITTSATSVLAALELLAASSTEFSITDLQYYASYGAFYLNCLSIPSSSSGQAPASSTPLCGQWQYSVNGVTPSVGMDSYQLHDHDTVFIYFGYPRQVVLDTTPIITHTPFTVTAESYVPATNSHVPAPGLVVGVTQPNPADPFSPIIIATTTSDASGQATFTLSTSSDYAVGLAADYYTPATSFTVTDAPTSTSTSTPPTSAPTPTGGGGSPAPQPGAASALTYLLSQQKPDGSFTGTFIDDWVALALASMGSNSSPQAASLKKYLDSAPLASVTDYERRAMALEALGANPNDSGAIRPIIDSFDGTQIGDPTSVNDDIFALFPLTHAGYTANDPLIAKEVAYILSQQSPNGSWVSIDLTAAAVQALAPVTALTGVTDSLSKAKIYLHSQETGSGCISNAYATSWTLQAITALSETPAQWQSSNGITPLACLATYQQTDGGFEPTTTAIPTRIWSTAYAILGLQGTPWSAVLQNFPKPTVVSTGTGGGQVVIVASSSSSVATSTDSTSSPQASSGQARSPQATATSTPILADHIASELSTLITASTTPATTTPPTLTHHTTKSTSNTKNLTATHNTSSFAQSVSIPRNQLAGVAAVAHPSLIMSMWHYVVTLFSTF